MKIELHNKILEDQLTEIAQSKYITPELLISEILREYVEELDVYQPDYSIASIKKEANKLTEELNTKLHMFQNRYEVSANLVESMEGNTCQIIPQRYKIKVVL